MPRPNFCTSSSSRRCSRVLRCRSSASRWATLRLTSPGHWMDFLFRKTTGKTSSFPRVNVSSKDGEYGRENTIPKLDPLTALCSLFFHGTESLWHQKSTDDAHTVRLFAVINPGVLREISSGNRYGSGASIRRRRIPWESLDRPPQASIL